MMYDRYDANPERLKRLKRLKPLNPVLALRLHFREYIRSTIHLSDLVKGQGEINSEYLRTQGSRRLKYKAGQARIIFIFIFTSTSLHLSAIEISNTRRQTLKMPSLTGKEVGSTGYGLMGMNLISLTSMNPANHTRHDMESATSISGCVLRNIEHCA